MSALGKKCTGCGNLVKEVSISKVYVNDFYYNRQSGEVHYALITEFSCPHCGLDLELTSQDLFIDLDPGTGARVFITELHLESVSMPINGVYSVRLVVKVVFSDEHRQPLTCERHILVGL